MRTRLISALTAIIILTSCSPRNFLTRRLASDLIAASDTFKAQQQFQLQTGVVSNKEYLSPEFLLLQHHGWISVTATPCPAGLAPAPCWDLLLTPSGVETVRPLIPPDQSDKQSFTIPVARRELVEVTGIVKQGNTADVEFIWKWIPLNEIGAALYSSDLRSRSLVAFRDFDDGWRVAQTTAHSGQALDEALKNAEPVQ
jgi:hypothetical protein